MSYATHAQNVEMAMRGKAHAALTDKLLAFGRDRAERARADFWDNIRNLIKGTR